MPVFYMENRIPSSWGSETFVSAQPAHHAGDFPLLLTGLQDPIGLEGSNLTPGGSMIPVIHGQVLTQLIATLFSSRPTTSISSSFGEIFSSRIAQGSHGGAQ